MPVAPPRPKGPPLNALRAFEAAARLQSFVAAADELSVTAGAVSQHIKALEGWTGTPLFLRNAQGVVLSDAGRQLAPLFIEAFDTLGVATRALHEVRPTPEIHIATMPSVAQIWLPTRLAAIRQRLKGVKLSVTALEVPPNLRRELFDLSIFLRQPTGEDAEIVLAPDRVFPVCAPGLAGRLSEPSDIADLPLLLDRAWHDDWPRWARAAGIDPDRHGGVSHYSLYSLALEEAKAGAGVLMGHDWLVAPAIAAGALVRPFDIDVTSAMALVLERATGRALRPDLATVCALLAE